MITEKELYESLERLGINDYTVREHPPLFSVEDVIENDCMMPGLNFKNLLIKDKKADKYYLVIIEDSRHMGNKYYKGFTGWGKIRFAHPEELHEKMALKPGSVSPYGLLNNDERDIVVVVDKSIREADDQELINFHPNRNTATLTLRKFQFVKFLESLGNPIIWEPCENEHAPILQMR